jgi:hypothetical protein
MPGVSVWTRIVDSEECGNFVDGLAFVCLRMIAGLIEAKTMLFLS